MVDLAAATATGEDPRLKMGGIPDIHIYLYVMC